MLKFTQPKVPSHILFFSVINFIFAAQQLHNQTHLLQLLNYQYYNTLTLGKIGRHPISLISPTLHNFQKLILLPSQPISLRIPTNLAATHWTIPNYPVAQPCLPQFPTLFPIFQHLIFHILDPYNFTISSTIWPQFQCYPASNLPRPTPPPAQRPPTLNSSSPSVLQQIPAHDSSRDFYKYPNSTDYAPRCIHFCKQPSYSCLHTSPYPDDTHCYHQAPLHRHSPEQPTAFQIKTAIIILL